MPTFETKNSDGLARTGTLSLKHGSVQTPIFMPVGTLAAVKSVTPGELLDSGTQILLGNTYHLFLQPGQAVLEQWGGLHSFMRWDRPILTDSGGFQIFSLAKQTKITEEGARFQSHLNGEWFDLTPEKCASIQQYIGSDIAMALDQCLPLPSTERQLEDAVHLSHRWLQRFLSVPRRTGQAVFGIAQGGTNTQLRRLSLELTLREQIDGLAIGGLSVGEPHHEMVKVLESIGPELPKELPHYLMGVGTPLDILEAVRCGIDMFDCVLPTRNGRNGGFFTDEGLLNIRNAAFRTDQNPIDPRCACLTCTQFTRGYLRHLFQTREILGCRLATLHNLHYYHRLMSDIREAIDKKQFMAFYHTKKALFTEAYGKPIGSPDLEIERGDLE